MSFRDLIDTCQSTALSGKLLPDDVANWHYFCREYSKTFHTPLHITLNLDPEFVITQIYSEMFMKKDLEENLDDFHDIISGLQDPDYDIKKERALREETKRMVEEENRRLEAGEAIHPALEPKNKPKKTHKELPKEKFPEDLPKSGGLNMGLIRQLQNNERESGEF